MNKILLNGEDGTNNYVIDVDTEIIIKGDSIVKDLNFIVENNICLSVLELSVNSEYELTFNLKENSRLIYNKASLNPKDKIIVNFDGISSSMEFRSSVTCKNDSYCFFELRHNASKTTSNLINHGVNNSVGKMNFKIDAYVPSTALDCVTSQENKIINMKCGKSTILPNLIIDTEQVEANHSAFIGNFEDDVMFYLKSRGINTETAQKLLMNGFLIGNISFDEQFRQEVENILKI